MPVNRHYTKDEEHARTKTVHYYLDGRRVCKAVFHATLGIGAGRVRYILEKKSRSGVCSPDRRGKSEPANKTSFEAINEIFEFIQKIPIFKSHYSNSNNVYFHPDLSYPKLYDLYMKENPSHKVSFIIFKRELRKLNISFYVPKKHFYSRCYEFKVESISNLFADYLLSLKSDYSSHLDEINFASNETDGIKTECKNENPQLPLEITQLPTEVSHLSDSNSRMSVESSNSHMSVESENSPPGTGSSGAHSAGSHNAGSHAAGSHAAGSHNAGSHNATHNARSHNTGAHNTGPHNTGPHNAATHNTGSHQSGGHNPGGHNSASHMQGGNSHMPPGNSASHMPPGNPPPHMNTVIPNAHMQASVPHMPIGTNAHMNIGLTSAHMSTVGSSSSHMTMANTSSLMSQNSNHHMIHGGPNAHMLGGNHLPLPIPLMSGNANAHMIGGNHLPLPIPLMTSGNPNAHMPPVAPNAHMSAETHNSRLQC